MVKFYNREKAQVAFRALSEKPKCREQVESKQAVTRAFVSWAIGGWNPSKAQAVKLKD